MKVKLNSGHVQELNDGVVLRITSNQATPAKWMAILTLKDRQLTGESDHPITVFKVLAAEVGRWLNEQ